MNGISHIWIQIHAAVIGTIVNYYYFIIHLLFI